MTKLLVLHMLLFMPLSAFSGEKFEDANTLFKNAYASWIDGRPEDAAGALKYIAFSSSDTKKSLMAMRQLSVILATLGKPQEAIAYLTKAEILNPADPYIHFERGWNYLALEKYGDARSSFEKVLTLTANPDMVAQTRFAIAMCEMELTGPGEAIKNFQAVYYKYPYLISPASRMISKCFAAIKKRQHSVTFLKQALEYDPQNFQAAVDLAFLYEKTDYYLQAWRTFYTLGELDPLESFFKKRTKKLSKYVKGKKDNLLYWTRLSWPVHKKPLKIYGKKKIRVALYSDENGNPAPIESFDFISNSDFIIEDSVLGKAAEGNANSQWKVRYNAHNRIYEIRDNRSLIAHSTRRKFKIIPKTKGGVILIKSPVLTVEKGINRGDKELMGEINLIPETNVGLIMVNNTYIENCVAAIISGFSTDKKMLEELKTFAVTIRTKLLKMFYSKKSSSPYYDVCDSKHCINFPGLQRETDIALKAARLTRGEVLYRRNSLAANVDTHAACGGMTESRVSDKGARPTMTPFDFYKWTTQSPSDELLCLPNDKTKSSNVYWTLFLDTNWIEKRANRKYQIGKLKAIIPLKRSKTGKLESLRIEGTANSAVIRGFKNISYILMSGALRSNIFDIRPMFKGKYPKYFIIRGRGTGHGRGLCEWGTHGMAKNMGYTYRKILKHYFPKLKIKKLRI